MKIGIYGLGRFGSFWAGELKKHADVCGYSRSAGGNEEEVLSSPALVLCVSISAMDSVLKRIGPRLHPGCVVMDTCSVKVAPVKSMLRYLPEHCEIIATHPMFGPDSARKEIKGLPFIYSPVRAREKTAGFWRHFYRDMGLELKEMTPDEHDREAAYTQGITHYIGRVLADLKLKPSSIGTLGYNKLLEIIQQTCNDSWQLFLDLQEYNPYTAKMRLALKESQEKIYKLLAERATVARKPPPEEGEASGAE